MILTKGGDLMPKVNNNFNKAEYDQNYVKTHYKKFTSVFTIEEADHVEAAAKAAGMTKSAFIKNAVLEKLERVENAN